MSELNPTPEELVEQIDYEVEDANEIPTPVDPTLTIPGEAADAYATGQAIASVIGNLRVNGKSPTNNNIVVYSEDILMSSEEGAQNILEAFSSLTDKDASEIMYDSENLVTIADALDEISETLDSEISESEIDEIVDEVFGGEE